ncbi:glycine cleavage system protein R [Teredinibacter haidensis]|uniref:glycine cleavage system protein R n=1 Tax=Teredinibacter haidensis TaxID=2731755 RepID=UPI0009FAA6F6|nr:ACT domain-containing protein [Teredinibacter haidensis]
MMKNLIVTLISDDKPGIVETVASVIAEHQGNWLESQLAQLAGKFAGVIRVQIDAAHEPALVADLEQLSSKQINVFVDSGSNNSPTPPANEILRFHATGPDRPGIVKEISHALAQYAINVEKLDTRLSSMPYSGEPLFEAEGSMAVPANLDKNELAERLDAIANELAMDISLQDG